MITYVIPCGAEKLDQPAPARELYVGQMFRHTWAHVQECVALDRAAGIEARVLILSARYGLVEPAAILEPYEQRIDRPGAVEAGQVARQALELGIDWGAEVYGLLPKKYFALLDEALRQLDVYAQDVYEAVAGVGDQRHINVIIGTR